MVVDVNPAILSKSLSDRNQRHLKRIAEIGFVQCRRGVCGERRFEERSCALRDQGVHRSKDHAAIDAVAITD